MKSKTQLIRRLFVFGALIVLVGCQTTQEKEKSAAGGTVAVVASTRIAPERAHQIGREMAEALTGQAQLIDNDQVLVYVNRVGQYVAYHLDNGPKNVKCVAGGEKVSPKEGFRFGVVRSKTKETVALPGGFVFISEALLADLKSEDQLAGLLAHEATNVICQHGMARMQKAADSVAPDQLPSTYEKFWKTRLPIRFQKVGDRGALLALYKAGYYPEDYIQLVEGIGDKDSASRVAWLKKDFEKMKQKGVVDTKRSRAARFAEFKTMVSTSP